MSPYQDRSVRYHKFPDSSYITILSPLTILYFRRSKRKKFQNLHLPHKSVQHKTLHYSEPWKYNRLVPRWVNYIQRCCYWQIWGNLLWKMFLVVQSIETPNYRKCNQDRSVRYHKFPDSSYITILSPLTILYFRRSKRKKFQNLHLPHKSVQHKTLHYSEPWKYNRLVPRWVNYIQRCCYWQIWGNLLWKMFLVVQSIETPNYRKCIRILLDNGELSHKLLQIYFISFLDCINIISISCLF